MRETAILVEDGGDGTFDAGDRIIFYGLGAEGWKDYYDPAAPDTVYHAHSRARPNYYYLTWPGPGDTGFPGQPLRIPPAGGAPGAGPDRTTYRERLRFEKNRVDDYDYGGDFWLWLKISRSSRPKPFEAILENNVVIDGVVPGVPQEYRTVALAPFDLKRVDDGGVDYNTGHHARYLVRDEFGVSTLIGDFSWDARWDIEKTDIRYEDGRPVHITGNFLTDGERDFLLQLPRDQNPKDWMYFAWFSIAYERRARARDGRLAFSSPDTTGSVDFRVTGLPSTGEIYAFDVTDRFNVRRITGVELADEGDSRRARFSAQISGARRHFWVTAAQDFGSIASGGVRRIAPVDLRNATAGPNMVIVSAPVFRRTAAARLAAHRRNHLPYYDNPVVTVVTPEEIYDNFSGGQPDPMAIRNYLKFLYDNFETGGNPNLAFALMLGDASIDYKFYASSVPDCVPAFVYLPPKSVNPYAYATDEWYAHMDAEDQDPGYGVGDIAIGRLPACATDDANTLVDKVIGYEAAAPYDVWRNQVVLVADDEGTGCESSFTSDSETIACCMLPSYTDIQKVYLTEYPSVSRLKPGARLDLIEKWNDGATVINYIGHGSSRQMADEIVFLDDDVAKLNNGYNLPVMMAFSCTIGDYANPTDRSLSERLLLRAGGGAIATVSASALSFIAPNTSLNFTVFERMFPESPGDGVPIGEAVQSAKLAVLQQVGMGTNAVKREDNNWKYNLLSDPALRVHVPRQEIRLVPDEPDSLVAGIRKTLTAGVYRNGELDTGFDGTVTVRVHEPALLRRKTDGCFLSYYIRGGSLFRGTADVTDGRFEIDFRVPRYARTGPSLFFTAYANNAGGDAGETDTQTLTLVAPTLADSLALQPVDGAPRVRFGFKSGLTTVKPGESLQAVIRDQDGVNILNTTNEGRHALLIDDSPVPLDVTRFFEFDHGGTDTSGVLTYPLPELGVGKHRAILRVADSFAQTTLDTLEFTVTDPLDYFADVVLNYPNPFTDGTQFLVRLSNRAAVRLDIFTVSGKRIRRIERDFDGGERWIPWDGRDIAGDKIANGTYLYVATVEFLGVDRAPLVVRGKLTKIQ
jgi:hypothetical protein